MENDNVKMKKWPLWVKWGIWFAVVGEVFSLLIMPLFDSASSVVHWWILFHIPVTFIQDIFDFLVESEFGWWLYWIVGEIFAACYYFLLGAFAGWSVRKIKTLNKLGSQ